MAALLKHVCLCSRLSHFYNNAQLFSTSSQLCRKWMGKKGKQDKLPALVKMKRKEKSNDTTLNETEPLFSIGQSIMARGFLRPIKAYQPPDSVEDSLKAITTRVLQTTHEKTPIEDPDVRYKLFRECEKQFNHRIPNSLLHTMRTLRDVYEFYTTPIDVRTPLDALKSQDLPPNLHIQYEPVRFHPDDDTMFGGKSAFPQSSNLVTGLETRKKFKGFKARQELVHEFEPKDY